MAYQIDWDQVSTHVQDKIIPRVKLNVFKSNAAWYRMKDRTDSFSGGRSIVYPLAFEPEGGGGQYWSGADKIDLRNRNPIKAAQYYAINAVVPIVIMQEDEDMVRGPEMVMPLIGTKMKLANRTAVDLLGGANGLFSTGTNPKALSGLEVMIPDTAATLHTYGGIPSSSTVNTWWQPQIDSTSYVTGLGAGGNFVQATNWTPFDNMWARFGLNTANNGPTLVLMNWGVFNECHAALVKVDNSFRPSQDTAMRDAGFKNFTYKGVTCVVDPNVPRDSTTKVEKVYFLDENGFNLVIHETRNMQFIGWREPVDQFVRVAYILWRGQLCCSERRTQGKMTTVDTTATSPA